MIRNKDFDTIKALSTITTDGYLIDEPYNGFISVTIHNTPWVRYLERQVTEGHVIQIGYNSVLKIYPEHSDIYTQLSELNYYVLTESGEAKCLLSRL